MGNYKMCMSMNLLLVLLLVVGCQSEEEPETDSKTKEVKEAPYIAHMQIGPIEGYKSITKRDQTYYGFKGIPYAKPPVGELRFKPPEPYTAWENTRDGKSAPSPCSQFDMAKYIENGTPLYIGDEDCLFLNIFTTEFDEDISDRPVMVFIQGESYATGVIDHLNPEYFMDENVVLVVIQYRLGILGFLSTEDLAGPGNLGLMDQTEALRWIHNNIHTFGGNNLRITLFGQGSGSASVHFQMLSHHTIGLFQRTILQSGNALCPWALGGIHREAAFYVGNYFNCIADVNTDNITEEVVTDGNVTNIEESKDNNMDEESLNNEENVNDAKTEDIVAEDDKELRSEQLLQCLRNVDAKNITLKIVDLYTWGTLPTIFGPRIDGRYIPNTPEALLTEKRHKRCDMIIGITKDEGSFVSNVMFANEGLRIGLKYNFPSFAPISLEFTDDDVAPINMSIRAYDHYAGDLDIERKDAQNLTKMYGDRHHAVCADLTAMMHQENSMNYNKNVFFYELHYRGKKSTSDIFNLNFGKNWTSHGDDMYYIFPNDQYSEEDANMARIMVKMWTNFAATGNPTPENTGYTWDPFKKEEYRHLVIVPEPYMANDTRKKVRDFWTSLPTSQNMFLFPNKVTNLTKVELSEEYTSSEKGYIKHSKEEISRHDKNTEQEKNKTALNKDEL